MLSTFNIMNLYVAASSSVGEQLTDADLASTAPAHRSAGPRMHPRMHT